MWDHSGYTQTTVEVVDCHRHVRFSQTDILKAMNSAMMCELARVWVELDQDSDMAAFDLTGNGDKFSAGADIQALKFRESLSNPFGP